MKIKRRLLKLAGVVGSIVVAAFAACFGQPVVHGNESAINVIVTVFSILSGFLVAIIAIVGDPTLLPVRNWRLKYISGKEAKQRLIRQKWLFRAYLVTLALIFISMIIDDMHEELIVWTERGYLFLGALVFMFSLVLPGVLTRVQIQRMDEIIEDERSGTQQ